MQPNMYSFKSDGAIAKGLVVKAGSDKHHVAKSVLATSKNIGICQNDVAAAEETVEVAMPGGGAIAKLGGTVAFGDYLTADAAGKLIVTTTANDKVVAQAMQDGVANDLIPVVVVSFNL